MAACSSDMDCLLLGTCDGGVCRCRQGFRGPECGQLDLGPAPAHLGYRNATASTWGGLPVRVGGAWHMYVSMLTGDCPLGTFNNNSEVVHLASLAAGPGGWAGPYALAGTVVPAFAHNAAPRLLRDGSVAVWFIGYDGAVDAVTCPKGVPPADYVWPDWTGKQIAVVRSPPGSASGPWTAPEWLLAQPQLPRDWWHWDCSATNPSAVVAADGSVRMLYRGTMCTHCAGCPPHPRNASERLGFATAPAVGGPYTRPAAGIDLGAGVSVEDPFYWRGARGSHHLIAHSGTACASTPGGGNWCGVVASSADGLEWRLARAPAYGPNVTLANGTTVRLFARQRPQLLFAGATATATPGGGAGGTGGPGGAGGAGGLGAGGPGAGAAEPALLALVNGAQLLAGGSGGLMARDSFTLIQPVRP